MQNLLKIGQLTTQTVDIKAVSKAQTLGWQISSFNFPAIWAESKGKGIKVAVIDTAVDLSHPDIKIEGGWDFVKNAPLSKTVPKQGHGTHVCGIIGAKDNTIGIVGVAPECSLYSLVVLDDTGSGSYANIIKALDWCIVNKMDVINMSLGGGGDTPEFYSAIRRVYDAKIPMICAGGNGNWETGYLDFPGTYDETIAVAAVNENFTRATFSSIGPNIDVAAPGVNILSCTPNNTYSIYSGTSMATPFVTGLVAIMLAKHRLSGGSTPINNVEDVRQHLIKVCKDVDYIGRDSFTGYGIINPVGSVDFENQPEVPVLIESNFLTTKFRVKLTKQYSITSKSGKAIITNTLGRQNEILQINFTDDEVLGAIKRTKGG